MHTLRENLIKLLEQGYTPLQMADLREVVVYGAGSTGRNVASELQRRCVRVAAFLDANADALGVIEGVPCFTPQSAEARKMAAEGLLAVIAVFNYATDIGPIVSILEETGFARVISYYEIHECLELAPHFWLTERSYYRQHTEAILRGFDLLEDEVSRQIYHDHFALRLTFDLGLLREPDVQNQYAPADLPQPKAPLRLIDGGAFTGDTLEFFLNSGLPMGAVAAFEPDSENFDCLAAYAKEHLPQLGEVILMPCGLGEATKIVSFSAGAGEGSAISEDGATCIQIVKLDNILPTFSPTLIKLDIEGSEPEALLGASEIIIRDHPSLAVCLYHAPSHLWEIPNLIANIRPDYRFFLRQHRFNGLEAVLYALPK